MDTKYKFFPVLLLSLLVLGGVAHQALAESPPMIDGQIFAEPKILKDFTLQSADGQLFTREDLLGHWTLIYFGYTHCPDACPIAMHQLKVMEKRLRKAVPDEKLSVVMVTVDPERDTPEIMQQYVRHFNPSFHGLSGDPGQIEAFARKLYVAYGRGEENPAIGYVMYHTDTITITNPKGQFVAAFSSPHYPRNMVRDFLKILKYY